VLLRADGGAVLTDFSLAKLDDADLSRLSERGQSARSERENLLLTALFAFGTVYFFVAVQGTVWFAAHVVSSALLVSYALFSLDAARPVLAGATLGLAFLTRPTTALAGGISSNSGR